MDKNEMMQQIAEAIEDEQADADKYMKMAEEADEKYAPIFRDIAHEELIHKKHLQAIHDDMMKHEA